MMQWPREIKKCPRGVIMNIGKENETIEFKKTTVSGILSLR